MRKTIDMVTAAILLMGLGYVVAASAATLPGGEGPEPLLEFDLTMPAFASAAIRWSMLALAGFGAMLLLLSLAKTVPAQRFNIKRYATFLVWLAVLLLLYSIARPATEGVTTTTGVLPPETQESLTAPVPVGNDWMVGALLVAVIAAVITRLALVTKSRFWDAGLPERETQHEAADESIAEPIAAVVGDDPRSRVINAYAGFEDLASREGAGRLLSETPRHHAQRAVGEMAIERFDLDVLGGEYESVRFADARVESEDAERAETAWDRIRARFAP